LAGFVAGLLGEAAKFPLVEKLKRSRVRRAIYKDLALIRISLKVSESHYQHDHRLEPIRLEAFDYLYDNERVAFYELQESHVLLSVYALIRRYTREEDPEEAQHLLGALMMSLRMNADCGTLDARLLDHYEKTFIRYTVAQSRRMHEKGE
jgi:hypothetical protein